MVTYGLRQTRPQVRILAPHPLFVLLAILLLSGSSMAADLQVSTGDFDHYSSAPDTLASSVASSDSLARVVGGDIFGVYWSSFGGDGQITSIGGVSMRDRADGVQELATATYTTFKGVEKAIAEASASDPLVLNWLEKIYDQLYMTSSSGNEVVKTSIADLIASRSWVNTSPIFVPGNGWVKDLDVPNLLAAVNRQLYNDLQMGFLVSTLMPNGLEYGNSQYTAVEVLNFGFRGLGHLLFGATDHPIYGLSYNGDDKESVRGSWSLADIVGNGFQGLATLIGGSQNTTSGHRMGLYQWVNPEDPSDIREYEIYSLFDFAWLFGNLQNSLAKLEYVYASQEDIDFKDQEKPNLDAVKDNFFGDGEGAVNPDQIKDLAGISSGIKDSFGGAGSAGDAFQAINDSQSFWFFSQEVADALDAVNSPAVAAESDDDFMDQFVQGDDGFYSLVDLSPWDVGSYLGGS